MVESENERTYHKVLIIEIIGTAPYFEGWIFMAILQHTYGQNTILRKHTDMELPLEYRNATSKCDHCGTNRKRRDTYVIYNETTGEWKQVGRDCLAGFFNGKDPHKVARYAEMLDNMDEDMEGFFGFGESAQYMETRDYLIFVSEVIKKYGWISGTRARDEFIESTAKIAHDHMFPIGLKQDGTINGRQLVGPTERATEEVDTALEWLKNQEANNDYMHNLKTVCSQKYIDPRVMGIAASLLAAYHRTIAREEANREANLQKINSNYFGEVGKRYELNLKVNKSFAFEGYYGVTYIHKLVDKAGDIFVGKLTRT